MVNALGVNIRALGISTDPIDLREQDAGMTDPGKVIGFSEFASLCELSLAFVLGGALAVGVLAIAAAHKRASTLLGGAFHLPASRDIDKPLVVGSLLFGAGWGLAGFCPGPAIESMAAGQSKALVFVLAMVAGMALYEFVDRLSHRPPAQTA